MESSHCISRCSNPNPATSNLICLKPLKCSHPLPLFPRMARLEGVLSLIFLAIATLKPWNPTLLPQVGMLSADNKAAMWENTTTECHALHCRSLSIDQGGPPSRPGPLGGAGRQLGSHPVRGPGAACTREEAEPHPAEASRRVYGEGGAPLAGLCRQGEVHVGVPGLRPQELAQEIVQRSD